MSVPADLVLSIFGVWRFLAKSAEEQDALFTEFIQAGYCTIMGEVNRSATLIF